MGLSYNAVWTERAFQAYLWQAPNLVSPWGLLITISLLLGFLMQDMDFWGTRVTRFRLCGCLIFVFQTLSKALKCNNCFVTISIFPLNAQPLLLKAMLGQTEDTWNFWRETELVRRRTHSCQDNSGISISFSSNWVNTPRYYIWFDFTWASKAFCLAPIQFQFSKMWSLEMC